MAIEIRVPEMGESIVEATVSRWLKRPGDPVQAGEPVLELETEKVSLEVPAPQAGVLQDMLREEGDTVQVGNVLGTLAEATTRLPGAQRERPPEPSGATPRSATTEASIEAEQPLPAAQPARQEETPPATPIAQKMAQRLSIDLSQIKGTSPGGRITQEDLERYVTARLAQSAPPRPAVPEQPAQPATAQPEEVAPEAAAGKMGQPQAAPRPERHYEERVKLSRRRQTIARRLTEAHQATVMTTTFNEVDLSAVRDIRTRQRESFRERHGMDPGLMSFFIKAVVAALKSFPRLNSELDGDELVYKYYYDIGIAVADPEGLVVPVLREADQMTFAEIESGVAGLVQRIRGKKLTLEELSGGTFTITNGGVFGSLLSTPMLNPPQVGILGLHRIMDRPVALAGEVAIRPMMYVALTYDHRVVDGQEAVQFLAYIKDLLEDPARILLES